MSNDREGSRTFADVDVETLEMTYLLMDYTNLTEDKARRAATAILQGQRVGRAERGNNRSEFTPEPQPMSAEPEKQEKRPKPRCFDCNSVRMSHCSDPVNCGGVYWPDWMYQELRTENARLEKELARLRESREGLMRALKYPRYGTTAGLLREAASALDHYAAREGEDTRSFITPHMKRAANGIDAALANSAKLTEPDEPE